ncbi:MAG: aminotransferase class V-fold PLP-dependent enzyme [Pseudomonadota bacterium]
MQLDTEFVRAQFPAFAEPALRDQAFFENAGGSYTCRYVIWRLNRFYKERKVQPCAPYTSSFLGGQEMDEARDRLARALGVLSEELSFGPSTTANTYVLSQAFRQWMTRGVQGERPGAIIVTNQDHEANSGPWRRLEEDGIEIREWRMRGDGSLYSEDLVPLLEGARLLCFPHASNVVGEINDVARICRLARDAGVFTCVDGVSYAPHGLPNVRKLGADIYLFSAYKTYGPHQGIMVLRRALGMALPNQGHDFNAHDLTKRFTPAGPDHAQVAASAGIADYIDTLYKHHNRAGRDGTGRTEVVHDLMRAHEVALMEPLLDFLTTKQRIRLLGPKEASERAPTLALDLGQPAAPFAAKLAHHGILCAGGSFYADRALSALGVRPEHGVLRVSLTHYTTEAEVDRLTKALDHVV